MLEYGKPLAAIVAHFDVRYQRRPASLGSGWCRISASWTASNLSGFRVFLGFLWQLLARCTSSATRATPRSGRLR